MAKYKGAGLSLLFGTTEVNVEATSVNLTSEEADNDATTFADLAAGGAVQWYFEIEATADYGSSSFWSYCWDNAGTTVTYTYKPYGNSTASPTQPHFTGSVVLGPKPSVGGAAGEVFTFETRMDCTAAPLKKTS